MNNSARLYKRFVRDSRVLLKYRELRSTSTHARVFSMFVRF